MFPLESAALRRLRRELMPKAAGDVLEIGAGTGANLKYYSSEACRALTIADKELSRAIRETAFPLPVKLAEADVLHLPFADSSFDTVVETLLLCSVEEVSAALSEIKRVLKPKGRFIHIDHGLPEKKGLRRVFLTLAPLWHGITRSCRIDKTFEPLLSDAGFETMDEGRAWGDVFYWGISKKSNGPRKTPKKNGVAE